jgi:hypothetical protein
MNLSELALLRKMLNHLEKDQRNSIRLMLLDEKTKIAVEIADKKEDFGADTLDERYESVKYMIKQIDFVNHRYVDEQLFPNTLRQAI